MRTCVRVTSQGSAYARFRTALATGNATIAWAAATELPRIGLSDALALCLLLVDVDRPRYERAVVRWHGRLCVEAKGLTLEEAQLALAAFNAFPHGPAVEALAGLLADRGLTGAAEALAAWEHRRG